MHLLGYRATPEGYVRVPLDGRGRLWLEPVRVWLAAEGGRVVCYDEGDNRIPDVAQMAQNAQQAEARAGENRTFAAGQGRPAEFSFRLGRPFPIRGHGWLSGAQFFSSC